MALGMMVKGQWVTERQQEDKQGRFLRPSTTFRHWIRADGSSGFMPEADRYHLYVSWACPWAHRTAILRQLKGLDQVIGLSAVDPEMGDQGWAFSTFPGSIPDPLFSMSYLREIYAKADPDYTGRVTVPVLWDKQTGQIVNNESREIIRMLDHEFNALATQSIDLCPTDLKDRSEATLDAIYQPINNGVYRAGFATQQEAYEEAVTELFRALDHWEEHLGHHRYLCGNRLTEADICLFTTLLRFDPVYVGHFKCNLRRIVDYPHLWNYLKELYQIPGIKQTCYLDHIKLHYYRSHPNVNPTRIVPLGPIVNFEEPHDRERFSAGK